MSDITTQAPPEQTSRFGSGQAVKRVEDQLLLLGAGNYTNDVSLPGQTHLVFLRSPYPHAQIKAIDAQSAKGMPGVHGVFTGQELRAAGLKPMARPMNFKRSDGSALSSTTRDILATDTVRFVGEPVAAVVADTEEQAWFQFQSRARWRLERNRGRVTALLPPEMAVADLSRQDAFAIEAMRDDALVGTATQAAGKMRALAAHLELDELVVCTWVHDPQVQLRSFELLSQAFSLNTRTQQAPQTALV